MGTASSTSAWEATTRRKTVPSNRRAGGEKSCGSIRTGRITPIAHALRYPTGLAFDGEGRLFATDNQGDQNPFNELNHIVEGRHYGVPSLYEEDRDAPVTPPAVEIPHPWTRSVNGICFLPRPLPGRRRFGSLAGQGIGCEYNGRFLVRFTLQEVDGTVQGAVYPFSRPPEENSPSVSDGQLAESRGRTVSWARSAVPFRPAAICIIGGIQDSGWLGGANVGEIVRLRPNGRMPNGIREIRATPHGFEIAFFEPVERPLAERDVALSARRVHAAVARGLCDSRHGPAPRRRPQVRSRLPTAGRSRSSRTAFARATFMK